MIDERVIKLVKTRSAGWCECLDPDCTRRAEQFHHGVANTKLNRKLYPLLIDSFLNIYHLSQHCHLNEPLPGMKENEARCTEQYLELITKKES